MHIMHAFSGSLLALIAPGFFWGQAMPASPPPIVEPPRQQMQMVIPNLIVGPYLLNVTGKTFVSDVFLDVEVTDSGHPAPDGTTVTFAAAPITAGDSVPDGGTPVYLTAVTTAGHAKFAPDLAAAGDWLITLGVTGPAGGAVMTPHKVGIDPHRPPDSQAFSLLQIAIPFVMIALLFAFFRLRHIDLELQPIDRLHVRAAGAREQRRAVR